MKNITREEAIKLLAKEELKFLKKSDRESHIVNWWVLDETDKEFMALSSNLKIELLKNETFIGNAMDKKYDELILIGLSSLFVGVTNKFLSQNLHIISGNNYEISGCIEDLYTCPCCSFNTLDTINEYDICPLCGWEDDGSEADDYSSPNGKSLNQAKIDFKQQAHNKPLLKYAHSNHNCNFAQSRN